MIDAGGEVIIMITLVGTLIVLAILFKSLLERISVPSLVGYILIGFLLRLADHQLGFLSAAGEEIFEFLAKMGVIVLLFHIGLEGNISELLSQIKRAGFICTGNTLIPAVVGYVTARHICGFSTIPSLFVAAALVATSVGITVQIWKEAGKLKTPTGELLLDTAELDDILGIIFMVLLFAAVPVLNQESGIGLVVLLSKSIGLIILKLLIFGALCYLFSIKMEGKLTRYFRRIEAPPDPMLLIAGTGIIIAAIAGLLGFSVAIGAFFAGLAFSRDPESVKITGSFRPLYELFSPFFFIGIGLHLVPEGLGAAAAVGLLLTVAAFIGKIAGGSIFAYLVTDRKAAVLIGFSMVPRAEIAMIIMQHGKKLGDWAVPPRLFGGMVIVSALTCLLSPFIVRFFLNKWSDFLEAQNE